MSAYRASQGGGDPSEEEVRALVAAVIAELTAEQPEREPGSGSSHEDATPAPDAPAEVAIGADHGGYRLKERIVADLREQGLEVRDCGTDSTESVDYPEYAHRVARLVADGSCRWGIVVDGAGIGSCMVANKVPGIRAATCWDVSSARNSREHNHANVLALGAGLIGESLALQIVQAWLSTPWGGDRHARRVDQIAEIERRYLASAAVGANQ
ncbi:MAG TPA: ribose 5-phosphate isomerase B [Gaiellaceae bacterium]|nr:ribose 5-phosphate isomerase B [Gaiellaceae bacterium]